MMEDFYQELGKSKIRPVFSDDLLAASRRGAAFYTQLLGGPALYNQRYGNPMMRRRHFLFQIDETARKIWLRCFYKTLEDSADYDFSPEHLQDSREWLDGFSRWMVNKRS